MKSYLAYTRVSTQKQGQTGVSLQEQRAAIERYAKQNRYSISEWFEERVTAAKRGRPIFTTMLKKLRAGKAAGVIIHKIDRSARNLKDWSDLGELIDSGIDVRFVNEGLDLSSRGGRLSADLQAVVAADFIRNLREETRKGMYGRLRQGLYPCRAPIGYLDQGRGKPKIPDPAKATLIRHAFERYATATCSLKELKKELYELGLRNLNGGAVSLSGLSTALNNPFYTGIIRLKSTGETFKGVHEPIISVSLFGRVQAVLTGKTNARSIRHEFLFRRMLTCYHCGYSLIGERQKGNVYYRCHTSGCLTKCVKEQLVSDEVLDVFDRFTLRPRELQELFRILERYDQNWKNEKKSIIKTSRLNLGRMNERSERLTDALVDGLISKDIFEERRAKLLMSIRRLEEHIEELQTSERSIPQRISEFLELLKTAKLSYISGNRLERRQLLNDITSNRFISGKNVVVELREPFATVANRSKIACGDPFRDRPRTSNINAANVTPFDLLRPTPQNSKDYITVLATEVWEQFGRDDDQRGDWLDCRNG
ncbi:recombinase family protein [bacterium AH-315-P15]|nr:recombinase family protein [bacterium AH-315-P15]